MPKLIDDPNMTSNIVQYIEEGNPVEYACDMLGISTSSFYGWRARGRRERIRLNGNPRAKLREKEAVYLQFLDATTRAQANAKVEAVATMRAAILGDHKTQEVTRFTETRLNAAGQPYQYEKTTTKAVIHPPDWRAAESYLKRRDVKNFGDKFAVGVDTNLINRIADKAKTLEIEMNDLLENIYLGLVVHGQAREEAND